MPEMRSKGVMMIRWTQENGQVFTFDTWEQVVEELKTWNSVEYDEKTKNDAEEKANGCKPCKSCERCNQCKYCECECSIMLIKKKVQG